VGEGLGRTWYAIFDTGSTFAMMTQAGAELTQMENRFIPSRFKDGYGPVGAWFLLLKSKATNAYGEDYTVTRADELKKYEPYGSVKPTPTPLRNHLMLVDILDGKGPIYMRTDEALRNLAGGDAKKLKELENEAWEDFLDMTISQGLLWAGQNIAPEEQASELQLAEPYIMGSHSGCAGMWVSGPDDLGAPADWSWGYNRMTTVKGLFTAGDGVGAAPHKFSSGSFAEGRIAAKAAVAFVRDNPGAVEPDQGRVDALKTEVYQPLATYEEHKGKSTVPDVNPNFITPKQGLTRLQKLMDEYAAGTSTWYRTSEPMLNRAIELLTVLKEDLSKLGASNLHELMRAWELHHRTWTAEAHVRHMLSRKETRWPGYYYRTDYPDIDDANWKVFVNSKYDPATGDWEFSQKPYVQLVP